MKALLCLTAAITMMICNPAKSLAADAYWLDELVAFYYLTTFQLDNQFKAMKAKGAKTLLLHSDDLANPILSYIAWRAKEAADLKTTLWIQWPNLHNLRRVSDVKGVQAVQVDDHFFANPPISLKDLKKQLGEKELWCSYQPGQWSNYRSNICDKSDIQLYRQSCESTISNAYWLGITGRADVAISTYHTGAQSDDASVDCISRKAQQYGNDVFVFKWANTEAAVKELIRVIPSLEKYLIP
ncbi:MAG: hypothetical protein AB8B70_10955 [Prochlorococcus sp.]